MKKPDLVKSGEVCKLVWKKTNIEERRDIVRRLIDSVEYSTIQDIKKKLNKFIEKNKGRIVITPDIINEKEKALFFHQYNDENWSIILDSEIDLKVDFIDVDDLNEKLIGEL